MSHYVGSKYSLTEWYECVIKYHILVIPKLKKKSGLVNVILYCDYDALEYDAM
jgi:hypothetical protein